MSDSRHRRPRRRRGIALSSGGGRRRNSGVLEETPLSPRELQRSARKVDRRSAGAKVAWALAGAVAIIAGGVALSVWLNSGDGSGDEAPSVAAPDGGAGVVLAITDGERNVSSLALLAVHETEGSRLMLFPPSTLTVLPGFGEGPIRNSVRFESVELAGTALSNLLGARIDAGAEIPAAQFEALIDGTEEVVLATPVVVTEDAGAQVVALAEGGGSRSAADLALIMTEAGQDDELTWLVRQQAVWNVLLPHLDDFERLSPIISGSFGDIGLLEAALRSAAVDEDLIASSAPVTRLPGAGGDVELYTLGSEQAASIGSNQIPFLRLSEEPRLRVEVLNGNGQIGSTRLVADVLIESGMRVVKTDNADSFTYETTRLIAQGRDHQQLAVDVQELLGLGEVVLELRQPSQVVDLTIIVGSDLPSKEL